MPAGRYTLIVRATGYLTGSYGQRRPDSSAGAVVINEGVRLTEIEIRMWKAATISGTVFDELGEPVVEAPIRILKRMMVHASMRLVTAFGGGTDDRGAYRISGLSPGEYLVVMPATTSSMPASTAETYRKEKLVARSAKMGRILCRELRRIQQQHSCVLGCFQGKGLVAGIQVVKPGTREPDAATAQRINEACFRKGLLMFAPVGIAGECLKVSPPLTISEPALRESIAVFDEAVNEIIASAG